MSSRNAVIDGQPATWEQYLALPEHPRVEFIDGLLRVRPRTSRRHQQVALALAKALVPALPPSYDVTLTWGWSAGGDGFIPDLMVHPVTDEDARFTGVPLLVAEVLSTGRNGDLELHLVKYAAAGLPHLWIVDPTTRTFEVLEREPAGFRSAGLLTAEQGGPVDVPFGAATACLDLPNLL